MKHGTWGMQIGDCCNLGSGCIPVIGSRRNVYIYIVRGNVSMTVIIVFRGE